MLYPPGAVWALEESLSEACAVSISGVLVMVVLGPEEEAVEKVAAVVADNDAIVIDVDTDEDEDEVAVFGFVMLK